MNNRERFIQRRKRVRAKVTGTSERPRISVFKSHRYLYAQIIDDSLGKTLGTVKGILADAEKLGEDLAKLGKAKKITLVVFDKGGYRYHGRIKALADGARKGGLIF